MGSPVRPPADQFRSDLSRLARSARRRAVVRRVVPGLAAGFAVALAFALARPFLPPPVGSWPPIFVTLAAAGAGAVAGTVLGMLARIEPRRILIDADRALGTRELAGAAFDLLTGSRQSAFRDAIVSDAAERLRVARPGQLFGRLRIPLWPLAPVLAAAALAASLLPFSLRDLFPRREPEVHDLLFIGDQLGEAGRKLADTARERDLRRELELALNLEQLGAELADHQVPPDELAERLAALERDLAAQLEARMRRAQSEAAGQGSGGTPGTEDGGTAADGSEPQGGGGGPEAGQAAPTPGGRQVPSDARELADALGTVQGMQRELSPGENGGGGGEQAGSTSGDRGAPPGGSQGSGDAASDPRAGSLPGSTPEKDAREPTIIAKSQAAAPLQAQAEIGEGSMARMLVRALPESAAPRSREDGTLQEYRRQAESALSAEQVPLELRGYVKDYFLGIGVTGK